ncbi:hypothetical protein [Anaerosalibacter sp. Marseille-P3206]|uniref:hypothetical protein n=1 Tax=Anaerosalibacter sp. Marseille-P3206 TaxID=1871005 RepID=UPI000987380D|nr:hypothetical protein [Anaerosalibacter sp. Marseille-P3206]
MITTIDKSFLDFAEKEIKNQMLTFLKRPMEEIEVERLAKEVVKKIDWDNSALMHKGLSWIAKKYLEQMEMQS